tara:strand:+ start:2058 stop:2528 length:471 start_codon:yes stop_codon:yes gene_type:complete
MVNKNSSILPVFESRTLKNVQYIGAGRYAADAISGVNGILDQYALKCWPNPAEVAYADNYAYTYFNSHAKIIHETLAKIDNNDPLTGKYLYMQALDASIVAWETARKYKDLFDPQAQTVIDAVCNQIEFILNVTGEELQERIKARCARASENNPQP